MTVRHHIIGPDGSWLGSSPRLVIAEAIQAIYAGSIIVIEEANMIAELVTH